MSDNEVYYNIEISEFIIIHLVIVNEHVSPT